ncbi:hypothetical protein ACS0TY_021297 [Phlomoides rotata]
MTLSRGFLFAVLVVVAAVGNASAATYIVGDTLGWTVPPSPAAYAAWASRQVFRVGDVLVFNYTTGFHDVAHVTKAAFDGCSSNNPIALATVGPSNFTLSTTGEDYYICTFGSHCAIGQKLAINVTAASSTTPAPTMPPSTTPTTPAPTMPPSTTPTTPAPTMPPSTTPTTPTPTMPPTMTPTPMSTSVPSPSPSSSSSPSGAPTPGSTPSSPTPSGSATPPPAPASESTPNGSLSPPPSSATVSSICAPLVVFASIVFALVI